MTRPSSTEYQRAILAGEQARRAGHKPDRNPYKHGTTERDRLLAEAWDAGHERASEARGGRR